MTKEKFIRLLVDNNYEYSESKLEIRIDKVIDDLGNVDGYLYFDKKDKNIQIVKDKDIYKDKECNHCYVLSEFEIIILKYFSDLLEKGVEE